MRRLALLSSTLLLLAGPAAALQPISLSQPVPDTPADACPLLAQIKYPWLRCEANAWGGKTFRGVGVPANARFESERQSPRGHVFVEGDGAWIRRSD